MLITEYRTGYLWRLHISHGERDFHLLIEEVDQQKTIAKDSEKKGRYPMPQLP
jgi:hypothetical protein